MKIEKFDAWFERYENILTVEDYEYYVMSETWNYQQMKIDQILAYISLIGHQKDLHFFLKEMNEEDDIPRRNNGMPKV